MKEKKNKIELSKKTVICCADNEKKVSHLIALKDLGDLKIFGADLTDEGSFDAPIAGCDLVFHLATPVHFGSEDPEVQNCRTHIPNFGNNVTAASELLTTMLLLFF